MFYPVWLAYATCLLEQKCREVRLVDAPARGWDREETIEDVERFSPDLLIIDCNFSSLSNDINVAELLKNRMSDVTIVMVGPPVSQYPDRILGSDGVDIIARYEYDLTLLDIAEAIENKSDLDGIKGISYKKDGNIFHTPDREFTSSEDLDRMPFVSMVYKKHLNIKDYFLSHSLYPEVQVMASRGCPNLCTFCSWPKTFMGRKYRARSPKNIVDEMEYIQNKLPEVREVFFEDDTFMIGRNRIREFCTEVKRRNLSTSWSCQIRADLDYETLKMMKDAGCRLVDIGYESGSDEILRNIRKGVTTEQARRFTADVKRAGLMIMADFVFGFPGETRQTAKQTIRLAKDLKPNIVQFAVAIPIPGTEFYDWAKNSGFLITDNLEESIDEKGFQKCIISYPEFTDEDIVKYVDKALKEYYLSPSYIPIALSNLLRKNGLSELRVMIHSARTLFEYLRRNKLH